MKDDTINNLISNAGIDDSLYYIGIADGRHMKTLQAFLSEMRNVFNLPDYYSENLNSLAECLNDLEWLNKSNYLLIIKNSDAFLKGERADVKKSILEFLDNVAMEWGNVPNFEGEDSYRKKSDFQIKLI